MTLSSMLLSAGEANTSPAKAIESLTEMTELTGGGEINTGAIEKFFKELPDHAIRLGFKVVLAVIAIIICWQLIRVICKIALKSLEHAKVEEATAKFIVSFIRVLLRILLLFGILAAFGMDTASIVAILGSAGVAIGLAIQGTLSNFAGGLLILIVKPFKVGDYILIDGGREGTVVEISLINTKLRTLDNRIVILPNGSLSNATLINSNGYPERVLETKVGVSYTTDIQKAREVLTEMINENEYVLQDGEKRIYVDELGDSSIILGIRCWVHGRDYLHAKWKINEEIKNILDENGIEIPFPQMDVHLKK